MRTRPILTLIVALLSVIAVVLPTTAEVPQRIPYQGRLTDGGGAPVADGAYLVSFTIYDAAVGGTALWSSGFQNISTEGGLFSYDLGSNVALPDNIFTDTSRWLGITVGVDPELSPRTRLATSAYSYHALRADTALVATSSTGVTQSIDPGTIIMTGFLNILGTDSIDCPADGYVMVNSTMTMNCNHTSGDDDVVFALIVDSTFTILSDQDNRSWNLPPGLPTASYSTFVHSHKVFPVSAGWNKFVIIGSQNVGGGTDNFFAGDVIVSLLFIPQAFGDVAVATPSPPNSPLNNLPLRKPGQ